MCTAGRINYQVQKRAVEARQVVGVAQLEGAQALVGVALVAEASAEPSPSAPIEAGPLDAGAFGRPA